ncbi:DUF4365 domain-containing protein [Magnetospirillum sp. 15-1]|uniref:DUF4365 domain-containing protein n=1 Tax=Magnetospirillum sp. 15-1 TaxID=1979370 RepID=UPI000BBCB3FB|nr:DUF4365 domain-containing protein [Magnetospirillum sp. 15-1]
MASNENTARKGVNAVEATFLEMGWLFRDQPVSDYGVDAHAEIVEDGEPTGKLIALQIKSGSSFFKKRGNGYVFRGEARHLSYWTNHSLPVILILHNPETQLTVWTKIERHLVTEGESGSWTVEIPSYRTLSANSATAIADSIPRSDPESMRRDRMALALQMISEIEERGEAYLTVDEWVNKSLNFRGAAIHFGEPWEKPDYIWDFYYPSNSISGVMDLLFPWLSYTYHCSPEEDGSGEVMTHTFEVEINDLGRAFLMMERFYQDGPEPSVCPDLPEPSEDHMDEDDWNEYLFQEALRKDRESEAGED